MDLEQKLMEVKLIISEKEKFERKLNDAKNELLTLTNQETELFNILAKEEKDVKRLESISLANIWFSFLGSKTEKLNKEKEEFSKAEYNYKIVSNNIKNIKIEIDELDKKLQYVFEKEKELEYLLSQKEEQILSEDLELSERLRSINNKITNNLSQEKEIKEALKAGKILLNSLNEVLESLRKAKNWGTYDVFGGGFIADMVKHSHLNQAKANFDNLKYHINHFSRELKDVNMNLNINIDISGTLKFADWFFDGLIFDLTVQSKIKNSIAQVENQLNVVNSIIYKLNDKLSENTKSLNLLYNEKKNLLS